MAHRGLFPIFLSVAAALNATGRVRGATFHVRTDASPGGDGLSWVTAFPTIAEAMSAADTNAGTDDLWIAGGTYRAPLGGWTLSNLRLFGGFAGTETLLSERSITANQTVLTGDQIGDDAPIDIRAFAGGLTGPVLPPEFVDNVPQILLMRSATLDGVTVTGVNTPDGAACVTSNSTIRNCLFRDHFGGAVISIANNIVATSTFVRSVTTTRGAAIAQIPGGIGAQPVRVYNCRFHQNYAVSGGAVAATHHGVLLANCVFTGNVAVQGGAALHVDQQVAAAAGMTVDLVNCTAVRNRQLLPETGVTGVAVYTRSIQGGTQVRVRNSIVIENTMAGFAQNPAFAVDIARASSGSGGVLNHVVERSLATVEPTIPLSAPINPPGSPVPPPGFEALSGNDAILGTVDDEPRLMPRVTPCTDRAQGSSLPADEADLDEDGDVSEPLPIDINGLPRDCDDPDVVGPTGGTLDAGAAELQSGAGMLVTGGGVVEFDPDSGDTFARLLVPSGCAIVNQQPAGIATMQLTETALPAVVVSGFLELERVALSTPGDVWIGDPAGGGGLAIFDDVPPGTLMISCRSLDFRNIGSNRILQPVSVVATEGLRVRTGSSLALSRNFELVGQVLNEGGFILARSPGPINRVTIHSGGYAQAATGRPGDPAPLISLWASGKGTNASLTCDGPLLLLGTIEVSLGDVPPEGPPIGQSWTLLAGSSRSGLFDTAFLPGWTDRLTRLVYTSTDRASTVVAQVESRDNVVALDPPLGFPVPGTPRAAAAGKVHAAAYPNPDLAVVVPDPTNPGTAPGTLRVLLNQGNTATSWNGYAAVTITRPTGIDPTGVVIAELTGDNHSDIAVTNRGSDSVRVFINNGADDFPTFTDLPVLNAPESLAAADFDADGDTDLAVTCFDTAAMTGIVRIFKNNGAGVFAFSSKATLGSNPTAIIAADLDNQNGPDLAIADTGDDRVAVLFNNGTLFRAWQGFRPVRFTVCDDEPSSIQPGNIDNGKDDSLITANTGASANSVTVLRPAGPGGPEDDGYTSTSGPIGETPRSIALVDVNNDGLDDIVAVATVPGMQQPTLRLLIAGFDEAANVVFTQAPEIATPTSPSLVLAADLDNDGSNDVVTVGTGGDVRGTGTDMNNVAAVLTRPPCPADLVVDAGVNTADLVYFLGRFGQPPTPGTPAFRADFNRDGSVNTADLVFFLGRFGQACP